jgi:hypothetical protein
MLRISSQNRLFRRSTILILSFQTANAKEFFKQDMSLPNRMFEETGNVMFDILSSAIFSKKDTLKFRMFVQTFESRTLVPIRLGKVRNFRQDTNIEIEFQVLVHTNSKMTSIFTM